MTTAFNNPRAIAEAGERIYDQKFRAAWELKHSGKYAVINVEKEIAFLGVTPDAAFEAARQDDPRGVFHLVRIGFSGAFTASYQYGKSHGVQDWLFG
jgi:hypothetical protein